MTGRALRAALAATFAALIIVSPRPGDAQAPRAAAAPLRRLEHGTVRVRTRVRVGWASAGGEVAIGVVSRGHALRLVASGPRSRLVHAFARPTFGSGPTFVEYGTWHPESLALRIFETAPSLGWPRFTACVRLSSRPGRLQLTEVREEGTELGCD